MPFNDLWPNGCAGAVSVTFDDGSERQQTRGAPALAERGLCGTFYVTMAAQKHREAYKGWIDIAAKGHEIGNHTCSHLCSCNFSDKPDVQGLENISLAYLKADILAAEAKLRDLVPEQKERTFAYPCYQTWVGRGARRQSYVPLIATHFVAGRGGGEYGFFNNPLHIDLACAVGTPTERMSCTEMIGLVELAMRRGHWIILVFHEIGAGRLGTSEYDFQLVLDHLADNKKRIWTAPSVEVARKIRDYQNKFWGRPSTPPPAKKPSPRKNAAG